jgi:two-component system sensor histidine kinase CreC
MTGRSRLFLGLIALYLAAVGFLLYRITLDIDPRYRESAEESLVDTANLLATLLERSAYAGIIPTDDLERTLAHLARRPVYAKIFEVEKTAVDLHVYVTDRDGIVLFDSRGRDAGADYIAWRDVQLTLAGAYGARTTLADAGDPGSEVMYVGAPIREARGASATADASEDIIGMVAVGKPVAAFHPFITSARTKLITFGAIAVGAFLLLAAAITVWLVRPFGLVRDLWHLSFAAPGGSFGSFIKRLAQVVRASAADVRDALAGRSYVDEYVQTLAHELKSPLAAIRGAAELMREPMPEATRARFAANIEEQVKRAQDMIDRLLELSTLERRGALAKVEPVAVAALAAAVIDELAPLAQHKQVALATEIHAGQVAGDAFLLQRALANLVRNAIEFAPAASRVRIAASEDPDTIAISVRDAGPGLPEYARARVFDKFYSLARPDTGKKSTGLGLAFVREVAALHGGSVSLANHADGGAVATFQLPVHKPA